MNQEIPQVFWDREKVLFLSKKAKVNSYFQKISPSSLLNRLLCFIELWTQYAQIYSGM